MQPVSPYRGVEVFSLRDFPRALELDDEGLHHPRFARSRKRIFTPYRDFTHLARSSKTLWLGTRRSTWVLPRAAFVDPNAPENVVRALLSRIARAPGGSEQLARMAQVEERSRSHEPVRPVWGLVGLCLLVFAVQIFAWPVYAVGYMSPTLVLDGELWRLVTANLLHDSIPHLMLNLIVIAAFGFFAGRPLGSARTLVVLGASALGAMAASAVLDQGQVVGASGVALGLVGSALWLELRRPETLPAWWRIPRPFFYAIVALEAVLSLYLGVALPIVAWGAHLGGFAAGFLVTGALTRGLAARPRAPSLGLKACAAGVVAVAALGIATGAGQAFSPDFLARHADRLAAMPDVDPEDLNAVAWLIAIAPDHSEAEIAAALRLAERAVAETDRERAHILDTLAEVQFQLGWEVQALYTIEEAIARDPDEAYYQEQRRRFNGERAADDRPPAPGAAPPARGSQAGDGSYGASSSPSSATMMRPAKLLPTTLVAWKA